jgi:hypothetical protein
MLKNSCSKLHCQKFFKLKLLSYKIVQSECSAATCPKTPQLTNPRTSWYSPRPVLSRSWYAKSSD